MKRTLTTTALFAATLSVVAVMLTVLSLVWIPPVEAQPSVRTALQCSNSVAITGAAAATVESVALAAGKRVYVCSMLLTGGGATAVTLKSGTGTTCGTGTVNLTGAMEFGDNTSLSFGGGQGYVFRTAAGHALCWTNSAAVQVSGIVSYAQF